MTMTIPVDTTLPPTNVTSLPKQNPLTKTSAQPQDFKKFNLIQCKPIF